VRYEICSRKRRKRIKHIMYGINWVKDKDVVVIDNMDLMRLVVVVVIVVFMI
jgi:hypothetical protein